MCRQPDEASEGLAPTSDICPAQGLGSGMDEQRCRSLVSVYDLDHSGALETEEFVTWMMLEHVRVGGWKGR